MLSQLRWLTEQFIQHFQKRAVENQEHPSKTTADDRSSSKSRKRQGTTLVAPDSSSKKSKPEQRAKTPSLPDMEVTSTASTSSDNGTIYKFYFSAFSLFYLAAYNTFGEFNHGASLNEGMTLNRWLDSHKIDAQPESMDWETSVSEQNINSILQWMQSFYLFSDLFSWKCLSRNGVAHCCWHKCSVTPSRICLSS